jgi:hypothetical protein
MIIARKIGIELTLWGVTPQQNRIEFISVLVYACFLTTILVIAMMHQLHRHRAEAIGGQTRITPLAFITVQNGMPHDDATPAMQDKQCIWKFNACTSNCCCFCTCKRFEMQVCN